MLVVVRGGGDIATGVIHRLYMGGFNVVSLEIEKPTVIRRTVAFAEAVYSNEITIEGVTALKCNTLEDAMIIVKNKKIPVIIDPLCKSIPVLKPIAVVDAILAKKNLGTFRGMAPIVIGIGPGFTAPDEVDCIVESNRGHYLGSLIYQGKAQENTGVPGEIMGFSEKRVIRSPKEGYLKSSFEIGDMVKQGDIIGEVDGQKITAPISGIIRGFIHKDVILKKGMKIGDIDPRGNRSHCFTISDKARAIGGAVLESILHLGIKKGVLTIETKIWNNP